ncbi:MAG: hypothetical protein KGH49_02940 [Candidatus Micrarchaeota archaeon]|nr:hypothetical protein [Candidatus Micrarchaeota archaeon]
MANLGFKKGDATKLLAVPIGFVCGEDITKLFFHLTRDSSGMQTHFANGSDMATNIVWAASTFASMVVAWKLLDRAVKWASKKKAQ